MRGRLCLLVLLLSAGVVQAQMYKWIGPDGKVNYTDTPPPPSAKQVDKREMSDAEPAVADLPYAVAEAVKVNPVTLFSGPNCNPCDDGRKLLGSRGIPFRERTVKTNADIDQFRQAGGTDQLPLLLIGRAKLEGFSSQNWNQALTAAGYPAGNTLPKTYRNAPPEPAAPVPAPPPKAPESAADGAGANPPSSSSEPPPATGNAPPGFRF